jgi:hypothetical protein
MTGIPTLAAELPPWTRAKPMVLVAGFIAQPLEWLSLRTTEPVPTIKWFDNVHVGFHLGYDCDTPPLADFFFNILSDISQISRDDIRHPVQTLLALLDARLEQIAFGHVCRRGPGAHGYQQDGGPMCSQPKTQRMLFEPDIKFSVAGFARARTHSSALCRPLTPVFFLSAVAAGRSVASMIATLKLASGIHLSKRLTR